MRFTKMHGLGNDFVVIADGAERLADAARLARALCDRRFGVGADGLMLLSPSSVADTAMHIFNADGSAAAQCGNALRCSAAYFYERINRSRTDLRIETPAGVQLAWLEVKGGRVACVRVDMGPPTLDSQCIPMTRDQSPVVNEPIMVNGQAFAVTAVEVGVPHAVIFTDDAASFPVETWGPLIENHALFPRHTNVEFVTVRGSNLLEMRVWERGVGQTLACGSGACAVVVAAALAGWAERRATVRMRGGDLRIVWDERDDHLYMTGPVTMVFDGEWLESTSPVPADPQSL